MKSLKLKFLSALALMLVALFAVVAQPQGGGGGDRRPQGTPEEQAKAYVERMSKQLELNKEQSEKIYEIILKSNKERTEMMKDGQHPEREKMEAMRKEQSEKIKSVLNKEQTKKYEEMQAKMQQGRQEGQRQRHE
ncbi:MAG: hypothetical protein SNH41_03770 [Rikenellaceae bacterium]